MASRRPRYRRRPAEPHEVAEIAVEAFLAATTVPVARRPPRRLNRGNVAVVVVTAITAPVVVPLMLYGLFVVAAALV